MKIKKIKFNIILSSLLITLILSPKSFGESTIILSEKQILELSQKGSPKLEEIEASFLNTQLKENELLQKYSGELFGRMSYSETNERAIIPFQPIFTPVKGGLVGVRKSYKEGIDTQAWVVSDQRSATNPFVGRIDNATTTTLALTAQIDLWKNLLGRMSQAELNQTELEKRRASLQKEISLKAFSLSLRRIYWALVGNYESEKISLELLKTAKRQLEESKRRLKNALAEADEVARYEAQLSSRESTMNYLKFQREALLKELRSLLPELGDKSIELSSYNLGETVDEVLACSLLIGQQESTPYNFTKVDETVNLLKSVKSMNKLINARYSDPDIKFFTTLKSTGVGVSEGERIKRGNFNDSLTDQTETNRTGYEAGVSFTYPLGDAKESTKKVKELYDEKRLEAAIGNLEAELVATHRRLSSSVKLLMEVIKGQKKTTEELHKRLKIMEKKYQQARASVDELVYDQDALLNVELSSIQTQLQILNTLFDYFMIYTETPCSFNRISSQDLR